MNIDETKKKPSTKSSKKPKENIDNLNTHRKNKIKIAIIISICILVGSFTIVTKIKENQNWSANMIAKEMSKKINTIYLIEIDDSSDNYKKNLNKSKVLAYDSVISKYIDAEKKHWAFSIEVFDNNQNAQLEKTYCENYYNYVEKHIPKNEFGVLYDQIIWDKSSIIISNNVVLKINSHYLKKDKDKLIATFEEILKLYTQTEKNTLSDDKYNKLKEEMLLEQEKEILELKQSTIDNARKLLISYSAALDTCQENEFSNLKKDILQFENTASVSDIYIELTKKLQEVENKFSLAKKNKAIEITQKLKTLSSTLDSKQLSQLESSISLLVDEYYDSYKTEWEKTVKNIKEKIKNKEIITYKNSCKKYKYKDVLRYPNNYDGKKAYWFGKVTQLVSKTSYSTEMRISVNCERNRYSAGGWLCSDALYVTYYGNESLIEDDIIKMWGELSGSVTYTTIFGGSVTIPSFTATYITRQ